MKIEIEVSEKKESTAEPWWMIVDPHQMMRPSASQVAMQMVTGPFFSREEAQSELDSRRYHYSKRAVVWCSSGCYAKQYREKYREAEANYRTTSETRKEIPAGVR